jgi:hypothetical protein
MTRENIRQHAGRATACGHVIAMAPVDTPGLVTEIDRRFTGLARVDKRFELADMSLDDATEAFVGGLNCRDCAIDPVAAALKLRAN